MNHDNDILSSFECFYDEIGPSPSEKHTVDRINNNLGYKHGNVRWATKKEQANNTPRNYKVVIKDSLYDTAELAAIGEDVSINTVYLWLNGWASADGKRHYRKKKWAKKVYQQ